MESKSREQFEAWFKAEIIEKPDFEFADFDEEEGEYIIHEDDDVELYLNIQAMLMAWQASRSVLVVDIASHTEFEIEHIASPEKEGYAIGWIDGRNYSVKQVRAAGITVKGEGDE